MESVENSCDLSYLCQFSDKNNFLGENLNHHQPLDSMNRTIEVTRNETRLNQNVHRQVTPSDPAKDNEDEDDDTDTSSVTSDSSWGTVTTIDIDEDELDAVQKFPFTIASHFEIPNEYQKEDENNSVIVNLNQVDKVKILHRIKIEHTYSRVASSNKQDQVKGSEENNNNNGQVNSSSYSSPQKDKVRPKPSSSKLRRNFMESWEPGFIYVEASGTTTKHPIKPTLKTDYFVEEDDPFGNVPDSNSIFDHDPLSIFDGLEEECIGSSKSSSNNDDVWATNNNVVEMPKDNHSGFKLKSTVKSTSQNRDNQKKKAAASAAVGQMISVALKKGVETKLEEEAKNQNFNCESSSRVVQEKKIKTKSASGPPKKFPDKTEFHRQLFKNLLLKSMANSSPTLQASSSAASKAFEQRGMNLDRRKNNNDEIVQKNCWANDFNNEIPIFAAPMVIPIDDLFLANKRPPVTSASTTMFFSKDNTGPKKKIGGVGFCKPSNLSKEKTTNYSVHRVKDKPSIQEPKFSSSGRRLKKSTKLSDYDFGS